MNKREAMAVIKAHLLHAFAVDVGLPPDVASLLAQTMGLPDSTPDGRTSTDHGGPDETATLSPNR